MSVILGDHRVSRERRRTVHEFGDLLDALETAVADPATPVRTARKAAGVLAFLEARAEEHAAEFFVEGFLLNFVGEAMVRDSYVSKPIVAFLKVGLYFYGLNHIERYRTTQATDYMVAHADALDDFTSRESLKSLVGEGRRKLEAGRPFCIVHVYLNEMRKRYWATRRASEDAVDTSYSLAVEAGEGHRSDLHVPAAPAEAAPVVEVDADAESVESRVGMMLRIFAEGLDERQQRIYLARHPLTGRFPESATSEIPDTVEALFAETTTDGRATWEDLAARFDATEKTIKREYIKSLLALLEGASRETFGDRAPSSYVRRMMRTLRTIAQERDLRIRDNAGRGLTKIVERWEIALRFVLNHGRSRVAAAGEEGVRRRDRA
ncbi:MAG: hypothetical protein R3F20_06040 [Planctomycetota bacterium]